MFEKNMYENNLSIQYIKRIIYCYHVQIIIRFYPDVTTSSGFNGLADADAQLRA